MSQQTTTNRAGFDQHFESSAATLDERVIHAWREYMVETLGLSRDIAAKAAERSLERLRAKRIVESISAQGCNLPNARVLELGSGLGDVAIELAIAGAEVSAVEPCDPWRKISADRSDSLGLSIEHHDADAHSLPFPDNYFDACVSLQVLEHVRDPKQVIKEISRVLKPLGHFDIRCENYLSFREQHYQVPWVPLLPKWLGKAYLKLLGRNPEFLQNHVTYTRYTQLVRWFLQAGLVDEAWLGVLSRVRERSCGRKESFLFYPAKLLFGNLNATSLLLWTNSPRKIFKVGCHFRGRKADGIQHN